MAVPYSHSQPDAPQVGWKGQPAASTAHDGGNGPGHSATYTFFAGMGSSIYGAAKRTYQSGVQAVHTAEDIAARVADVVKAVVRVDLYVYPAIYHRIGLDIQELKKAFIPALKMTLIILGSSTAGGVVVGMVAGALTGGTLELPAVAAGAELGFDFGLLVLDLLGIGFLLKEVIEALPRIFDMAKHGFSTAWNAGHSHTATTEQDIDAAAHELANAEAEILNVLLQGILIWILSKSGAARGGKLWEGSKNLKDPAALAAAGTSVLKRLRESPATTRAALREATADLAGLLRKTKYTEGLADFIEKRIDQIFESVTKDAEKKAPKSRGDSAVSGSSADATPTALQKAEAGGTKPAKPKSLREQYVGRTPGKNSKTGQAVQARMRAEGTLRDTADGPEFKASDGEWYPLEDADMAHKTDAVKWWNDTGRQYGPKSPEVRKWMLDPDNYTLDHYSINRSAGAKLPDSYLPPLE